MRRRGFAIGAAALAMAPFAGAAPAGPDAARLRNRLELWSNYSQRTRNIMARLTTTRETSLLLQPLVVTGQLVFKAPSTLILRDDGLQGSTTLIHGNELAILENRSGGGSPVKAIDPAAAPAAAWLADRLVRSFAPSKGEALIEGARTNVPRGRGYRLDLLPPRGSATRKLLRSLTLHLDPVAGAVTQILIAEAQGDRIRLQVTDHRQNVDDEDIQAVIDQVEELKK